MERVHFEKKNRGFSFQKYVRSDSFFPRTPLSRSEKQCV
jgi:hypothetical protein